ncbi:hypothetical protein PGB90_008017 [Kerria lacca]
MQHMISVVNTEQEIKKLSGTVKSETLSDRDAGFCSGEETDLDIEYHSPIDTSRDSTDVKEYAESNRNKNKRKNAEPRKVAEINDEPEIKLIKLENSSGRASPLSNKSDFIKRSPSPYIKEEIIDHTKIPNSSYIKEEIQNVLKSCSPFRPWSIDRSNNNYCPILPYVYSPASPNASPDFVQEEPLALVVEKKKEDNFPQYAYESRNLDSESLSQENMEVQDLRINQRPQEVVRLHEMEMCKNTLKSSLMQQDLSNKFTSSSSTVSSEGKRKSSQSNNSHQRNYKNMTRERRIEANARERTRVHTISAAFETLRKCVPAYANNQKLSKLSVLRIACSYIMTLSRIAGYDYSIDQNAPSISECVENVCNTIQMEGKTRKKKDD